MHVEVTRDGSATGIDFDSHVFASPEYLRAKSKDFGWFVGGSFIQPFYCDHILAFRRMVFPDTVIQSGSGGLTDKQQFLDEVVTLLRQRRMCDFIGKAQANAIYDVAPTSAVKAPWGTYEIPVDRTDSEILETLHVKHRNVVLKARRDGVIVRPVEDPLVVQACIRDTLVRQGLPYYPSSGLVRTLWETLRQRPVSLGAYVDGQLQGIAFVPYDRARGYYLYGGSIERPHGGAMNLLHYDVMRTLRDRGVSVYDLVGARIGVKKGTKYEGIQRFKSRFGATLRQGLTFRVVVNSSKYRLFNALANMRFHLRGRRYVDPIDQLLQGDYE